MLFTGQAIKASLLPSGLACVMFDLDESSVNKFDQLTLRELGEAIAAVESSAARGVVFASAKSTFIVGADITEFGGLFSQGEDEIREWLVQANKVFNAVEDLSVPSVAAINGAALGGGFELALSADFRVAASTAIVGFPEVNLGILPGFGGTVRLPRTSGLPAAVDWISSGKHRSAAQALEVAAVDKIVDEGLIESAEKILEEALAGGRDVEAIRSRKKQAVSVADDERVVFFEKAKLAVAKASGKDYPAAVTAVAAMEKGVACDRASALKAEHDGFIELAAGDCAANLVQMFLNDQFLAGKARAIAKGAEPVAKAAVLGAGIMGGGIAYQSALRGTPIVMKDIAQSGLDLGLAEAKKLLAKQVKRGKLSEQKSQAILGLIDSSLDYEKVKSADLVVEAVVENEAVKKSVLAELEALVPATTVIATNTSTISIDSLADALSKPERFCGMHFFNPVPLMPLVEVIRGAQTTPETVASTVAYARALGKTPIVVNNCPGFLVNRILFPYFGAFSTLLNEGADFRQIDRVMEEFGWPMGPAYLLDVVGIDTAVHAQAVMAEGFERMQLPFESAIDKLFAQGDLGQKSGRGFYSYSADENGRPQRSANPEIDAVIASCSQASREFSDEEIRDRLLLALCLETVRCVEEGIVDSAIEADMGLILGLGFPRFRGGALRYVDQVGCKEFCELAKRYERLGAMFAPPQSLLDLASSGAKFYA